MFCSSLSLAKFKAINRLCWIYWPNTTSQNEPPEVRTWDMTNCHIFDIFINPADSFRSDNTINGSKNGCRPKNEMPDPRLNQSMYYRPTQKALDRWTFRRRIENIFRVQSPTIFAPNRRPFGCRIANSSVVARPTLRAGRTYNTVEDNWNTVIKFSPLADFCCNFLFINWRCIQMKKILTSEMICWNSNSSSINCCSHRRRKSTLKCLKRPIFFEKNTVAAIDRTYLAPNDSWHYISRPLHDESGEAASCPAQPIQPAHFSLPF